MVSPLRLAAASTSSCCPTNREPGIGSSPDIIRSQYRLHPVRWLPGLVARHRHRHTQRLPNMSDELAENVEPKISKMGWGGARPNSGGRRPGSGRKKGTPNKVTAEIKELAQKYGPEA